MAYLKKISLYLLWASVILITLVIGAHLLLPFVVNTAAIKTRLLERADQAIEGDVDFADIDLALIPLPHATVNQGRIFMPGQLALTIDSVTVYPKFWALLTGNFVLDTVTLRSPRVVVQLPEVGAVAIDERPEIDPDTALQDILTRIPEDIRVTIENGRLDIAGADRRLVSFEEIAASAAARAGVLDVALQGYAVDLIDHFRITLILPLPETDETASADAGTVAPTPPISVSMQLRNADVGQVCQLAIELFGDVEIPTALQMVQSGTIKDLELNATGKALADLVRLDTIHITAVVEDGHLRIPAADLDVVAISGDVEFADGVLTAREVAARKGVTSAHQGTLRMELLEDPITMALDIALDADLAQIPPILKSILRNNGRAIEELNRLESLQGHATGTLRLDGALKRLAIDVKADIHELEAEYNHLPYPLVIQGGQGHYDKTGLRLKDIRGHLKDSTFENLTGELNWRDAAQIALQDLTARINLTQIYPWAAEQLSDFAQADYVENVTGWLNLKDTRIEGDPANPSQWRVQTAGAFEEVTIVVAQAPGPLSLPQGRFQVDDDRLQFTDIQTKVLDATLHGSATVNAYRSDQPHGTLSVTGTLGNRIGQWLLQSAQMSDDFTVPAHIHINEMALEWHPREGTRMRGAFELPEALSINLEMTANEDVLNIRELAISDAQSSARAAVSYDRHGRSWDLDFSGHLTQSTLAPLWPNAVFDSGRLQGALTAHLPVTDMHNTVLQGNLEVVDWITHPALWGPLQIHHLKIDADDTRLDIHTMDLSWHGQRASVAGDIVWSGNRVEWDLSFFSEALVLDDLVTAFSGVEAKVGQTTPKPLDLPEMAGFVSVDVGRLTYGPYQWEPVRALAVLEGELITFRVMEAYLCGISTPGSLTWSPHLISLVLEPNAWGQTLQFAGDCLAGLGATERLEGDYEVEGRITSSGTSIENLIENLEGDVRVEISDGRIFNIGEAGFFTNLLSFIKLNNLVTGDLPDMRERDFSYDRMHLQLGVEGYQIEFEDIHMRADAFNMVGEGRIDLHTMQINLTLLISPLTTLDALVRHIPLVGRILRGTLVAIPVGASGPVSNPRILPLSPSAVSSRVLDILQETLKTPFRIIEPILPGEQPDPKEQRRIPRNSD